jgi:hypothetical protein
MMTDLQIKMEKYETKAAQCKEWVRQLYEGLANYYAELATDFQKVIEKRKVA